MNLDEYLIIGHEPHAEPISGIITEAYTELLFPPASTQFKRFPNLNTMTGGLRPHEFTILCGATGTGKTTLCANWSTDFNEQGIPHFIASVETGHTDYVKRMISASIAQDWNTGDKIPLQDVRRFEKDHGDKFKNQNTWLSLYDNRFSVDTLMHDIAFMIKTNKVKIAIIDNLNFFLETTTTENAIIEMDRVIHKLIIFCKQVPIHVVMVMHPKKTQNGRVESEFDIKGSSTAVQEAHNIFLFNRPHKDLVDAGLCLNSDRELLIAKMRRKGKYVHRRLIIRSTEGVNYSEGAIV